MLRCSLLRCLNHLRGDDLRVRHLQHRFPHNHFATHNFPSPSSGNNIQLQENALQLQQARG